MTMKRNSTTKRGRFVAGCLLLLCLCAAITPAASAQKVSFRDALDLALKHSAAMGIVTADQAKARQGALEARNMYIPQVTFGSGVAKTWGYPMSIEGSAPSVFNINSQSYLLNLAQMKFVKAFRRDWVASGFTVADQRNATILETTLTYLQLQQTSQKAGLLRDELQQAANVETITSERMQAGMNSKLDVTKAKLAAARVRLRLTEAEANIDLLRQRLAQLTGLEVRELEIEPGSVPPLPPIGQQDDLATVAVNNSPAVKAADERAQARELQAQGERKQNYPAIYLVGNYGLFTKYNNLDLLFPPGRFSRNNATFGLEIRFPFLNAAQRSKAAAAAAEAVRARNEAQVVRENVSNETLKLQRSLSQLAAARDVARLESEVAQASIDAVSAKVSAGGATIIDLNNARIEAKNKEAALLDAQFELDRARLQLLRDLGELQTWALP